MKNTPLKIVIAGTLLVSFVGCGGASTSGSAVDPQASSSAEVALTDSSVENSTSSGVDAVGMALEENTDVESSTSALRLGARGCTDSDVNLTKTITCDDSNHTATILRDFGTGCFTSNDSSNGVGVTITGKHLTQWTNMGNASCRAADKAPIFWQAVQGQGTSNLAQRVFSTDPDHITSPVTAIVRQNGNGTSIKVMGYAVSVYSNATQSGESKSVHEQLTIPGTSRIRYKHDGVTKLFDHTVSTEVPLEIDLQKTDDQEPVRTVVSGTIAVSHNLAQFTVHTTFNNVRYDYNECECHPVSGTINLSVTNNATSAQMGSGSITFTGCETSNMTYEGRTLRLPVLDNCR